MKYDQISLPIARLAFTESLFKPKESESGKLQYGCTLLYPKDVDLSALRKLVLDVAKMHWGDKAEEKIKNGVLKTPFLDGDSAQGCSKKTGKRHDGFEGHWFIRVTTGAEFPPKIVNQLLDDATKEQVYSGCYGIPVVTAYSWDSKTGSGISIGLTAIQKVKEGEKLNGGAFDPKQHFKVIETDGSLQDVDGVDTSGADALFQ
jgi:hypothetical protein